MEKSPSFPGRYHQNAGFSQCYLAGVHQLIKCTLTWKETISKGTSSSKQHLSRDRLVFRGVKSHKLWRFFKATNPCPTTNCRNFTFGSNAGCKVVFRSTETASYGYLVKRHRIFQPYSWWQPEIRWGFTSWGKGSFAHSLHVHPRWWTIFETSTASVQSPYTFWGEFWPPKNILLYTLEANGVQGFKDLNIFWNKTTLSIRKPVKHGVILRTNTPLRHTGSFPLPLEGPSWSLGQ